MRRYYECGRCGGTVPVLAVSSTALSSENQQVLVLSNTYCQCVEFPGWLMELKEAVDDERP